MEILLRVNMTSQDAEELAAKLRHIEKTATWGSSAVAMDWNCGVGETVRFVLDQERARAAGLMAFGARKTPKRMP